MPFELRATLYLYLGGFASLCFALRFFYQWIKSEKAGKCHVTRGFWRLSLLGNTAMALHTLIQTQLHFYLIQVVNGVIAYQNLKLYSKPSQKLSHFFNTLFLCLSLSLVLFCVVALQSFGQLKWVSTPSHFFNAYATTPASFEWHVFGCLGAGLFALRFWVQLWDSFKAQKSQLNALFWILSLVGSLITCIYAARIGDVVQLWGYSLGIIPYARNLYLMLQVGQNA